MKITVIKTHEGDYLATGEHNGTVMTAAGINEKIAVSAVRSVLEKAITDDNGFPSWWQIGRRVVNKAGVIGCIEQANSGEWYIRFESVEGSEINPSAADWLQIPSASIAEINAQRIRYEAERTLLGAMGLGGVKDWASLPDIERLGGPHPNHVAMGSSNELRALMYILGGAIARALHPFVRDI